LGAANLLITERCILAFSDKEQWEPVIEKLYKLLQKLDKAHRIREAWSFDWQNHGDAAILNRQLLKVRAGGVCMSTTLFSTLFY
jgi:hypothetical protein